MKKLFLAMAVAALGLFLVIHPATAQTVTNAPAIDATAALKAQAANWIIQLAVAHQAIATVLLVIGALRVCFKPIMSGIESYLKANKPEAYIELQTFESGPVFKAISFVLDFAGSIKLPTVSVVKGAAVAAATTVSVIALVLFTGCVSPKAPGTYGPSANIQTNAWIGTNGVVTQVAFTGLQIGTKEGVLRFIIAHPEYRQWVIDSNAALQLAVNNGNISTNTLSFVLNQAAPNDVEVQSLIGDIQTAYQQSIAPFVTQDINQVAYLLPALRAVSAGADGAVALTANAPKK